MFYKKLSLGYWKQLLYGAALIFWSVFIFSLFSETLGTLEGVQMSNETLKARIMSSVSLWVFAYPSIVLAIGSNFVAQFFFSWDQDR